MNKNITNFLNKWAGRRSAMSVVLLLINMVFMGKSLANVVIDIHITQPAHHLAMVKIQFPAADNDTMDLKFPMWRTGRYEILDLSDVVRHFSVKSGDGAALNWLKTDKATWQVSDVKGKTLEVEYQIYANKLGERSRHIDDSHAFIDASGFVMYSDNSKNQTQIVNLHVPEGWQSVSGMKSGKGKHQFVAENFDVLIDSPIETGIHQFYQFSVDNRQYELVIWGKGNYDVEKMLSELKVMVQQSSSIWQGYPFERYVFMVHATSGARGATEHLNSTIIQRSRFSFAERKDYLGFLTTAAHEFVHTWNVKAYRPHGLVPYDYEKENYSNLIWLSEGSTSYLQYQLLTRGELMTVKEFLDDLAKRIESFNNTPGTMVQSVADASFDTWMSSHGDFAKNHSVGIYSEGYMASLLLDFEILSDTNLKHSYRDVHNDLYKDYKLPYGFTESDVKKVLLKLTGKSYENWWQTFIHKPMRPDFDSLLAKAGLTLDQGNKNKAWMGVTAKSSNEGAIVTAVASESPGWQAGLTTDDVVIALDGLRLVGGDLEKRLKNFNLGDSVELTYFRRDELYHTKVELAERPDKKLSIKAMDDASAAQKAFFKAWTGLNHPADK